LYGWKMETRTHYKITGRNRKATRVGQNS